MLRNRVDWPPPGDLPLIILVPQETQCSEGVTPVETANDQPGLPMILAATSRTSHRTKRRDVSAAISEFARQYAGHDNQGRRATIMSSQRTYVVRSGYISHAIHAGPGGVDNFWHGYEVL